MTSPVPLLLAHRRRIVRTAVAIALIALVALFPGFFALHAGINSAVLEVSAVALLVVVTLLLARGLSCPSCHKNLFWYGINNRFGNWINWLLTETTCPKCGYSQSKERH
jgi:hypothetical protein